MVILNAAYYSNDFSDVNLMVENRCGTLDVNAAKEQKHTEYEVLEFKKRVEGLFKSMLTNGVDSNKEIRIYITPDGKKWLINGQGRHEALMMYNKEQNADEKILFLVFNADTYEECVEDYLKFNECYPGYIKPKPLSFSDKIHTYAIKDEETHEGKELVDNYCMEYGISPTACSNFIFGQGSTKSNSLKTSHKISNLKTWVPQMLSDYGKCLNAASENKVLNGKNLQTLKSGETLCAIRNIYSAIYAYYIEEPMDVKEKAHQIISDRLYDIYSTMSLCDMDIFKLKTNLSTKRIIDMLCSKDYGTKRITSRSIAYKYLVH